MDSRIQAIQVWSTPSTTQELQVAAPLYALLKGEILGTLRTRVFQWRDEAEQIFQELQLLLNSAPILSYADFSLPFVL